MTHKSCIFLNERSKNLTLPAQAESVLPDPSGAPGASNGLVGAHTLANSSGLLAGGSEAAQLTVLVDSVHDPVDLWISPDGRMGHVHHDHLEVLVGRVLAHPVGVEDSQSLESAANTLLGDGLKVSLGLLLLDSTGALGLTIGTSLGDWPLASTTPHGNTVDDKSLLGLVSKSASLVGPGGTRSTVHLDINGLVSPVKRQCKETNLGELTVLPTSDPEEIPHHIALLLAIQF